MRYGLVRQIEGHAPPSIERLRLEKAGCEVILEEGPPTRATLRAQWGLLFNLKAGDELLVCSLDTLQMSTGQLVLLLHKFDQTQVVLKIVSDDGITTLAPSNHVRPYLALLAANEAQRPDSRRAPARRSTRGKPLRRYQIDYANELRRHGASLRMISQLFQIPPAELALVLDKPGVQSEAPQVVVSLPERRARKS